MELEKLKEQLQQGTFYYHKFGLLVKSEVTNVVQMSENWLEVYFESGCLSVYEDKFKKIRRPSNIIEKFEWCYIFKNEYDECIGYVGKIKE